MLSVQMKICYLADAEGRTFVIEIYKQEYVKIFKGRK